MDKKVYSAAYRKWVMSLPEKERAEMKRRGIDEPDDGNTQIFKQSPEVAFATASVDSDIDVIPNPEQPQLISMLAWILIRIKTPAERDALIYALGMNLLEGKTQTQIARKHRLTKAAFSHKVKQWQKLLQLPPSCFMKSDRACKAYHSARIETLTKRK